MSLEAAGRQLTVNLRSVLIVYPLSFPVLAGNSFTHLLILGAAANNMVAILGGKKEKNRYVTFFLLVAPASCLLFPDDSHRPREMLKWTFGPTEGASALGFLPGTWGRQCLGCFSLKAALCLPCRYSGSTWGKVPRHVFSLLLHIPVSSLWSLLYCFRSVFACVISFDPYNL